MVNRNSPPFCVPLALPGSLPVPDHSRFPPCPTCLVRRQRTHTLPVVGLWGSVAPRHRARSETTPIVSSSESSIQTCSLGTFASPCIQAATDWGPMGRAPPKTGYSDLEVHAALGERGSCSEATEMLPPQVLTSERESGAGEMETCLCSSLGTQKTDKNGVGCLDPDSGLGGG